MSSTVHMTVESAVVIPGYTIAQFATPLPKGWKTLSIGGKEVKTEIAYDVPNSVGIRGEIKNLSGKTVMFTT